MCNLITCKASVDEVAAAMKARRKRQSNAGAGEVYPGYPGMVVRQDAGERVLETMTWGFPVRLKGMQPTSKPEPVNNARDDKLLTFWKRWFTDPAQRCLIPITAFAEAEGPKGRMTRTWISIADQPIAACAGLWRPTDEWGDASTMVMVDAIDDRMLEIHDRMPVILHPQDWDRWLQAPADDAMQLVTQYLPDRLIVDRTEEPWSKRKPKAPEAPVLL